ncbi:ribosomal protein L37AE/L43A [Tsukamurella ocularis]|nr:ribosomal protein L37AE/L43A [Tsukamurella ocularis]
MGSKVELLAQIRRDARVEGLSIRALVRKHGVHRRTVRQALSSAEPPPRKTPDRSAPRLDRFKPVIDAMLRPDVDAPRKQRHTATRIRERLAIEHNADELSHSTVRDYVRIRRAQIEVEAGRRTEVFIARTTPQARRPRSTSARSGRSERIKPGQSTRHRTSTQRRNRPQNRSSQARHPQRRPRCPDCGHRRHSRLAPGAWPRQIGHNRQRRAATVNHIRHRPPRRQILERLLLKQLHPHPQMTAQPGIPSDHMLGIRAHRVPIPPRRDNHRPPGRHLKIISPIHTHEPTTKRGHPPITGAKSHRLGGAKPN